MTLRNTAKTALKGLETQKTRSSLTILGIVIGITAIIVVMSLGKGAQNLIVGQVQSIGSKTIAIVPGRQPKGPTDIIATLTDSLKQKDFEALQKKANVPHAEQIMPIVFGSETASYENQTYHPTIMGLTDLFSTLYGVYPKEGTLFGVDDIKSYADVAIIGSKVKDQLFGNSEALNEKIKIKNKNFRVIGIFPKKGQVSFLNVDDLVLMPYTTAQQYIFGIKYFNRLVVQADSEANVQTTVQDIAATLRQNHNISDPSKDDFFIETQAQAMQIVSTIANILTLFLAAVAAISLVVGGIGIMNIMLVSVAERTREIGLRKALGATENNIMAQFLFEAIFLTAIGGFIGIVLGALLAFGASFALSRLIAMGWTFVFPISGAILGLGVSALIGLIFGLYPARQASLKSPIEALRYE